MFSAAHEYESNALDLFRLALKMVSTSGGEVRIPNSLKDYFILVLNQAKEIAKKPESISGDSMPEAIELAVELREIDGFLNDVNQVDSIDNISPALANKILSNMEVDSVCKNGFSSLTGLTS